MEKVEDTLVATLRRQIVRGGLKPGERMPDRRTLVRTFDVSPVTVQAAMRRLVTEGFVTVGARKHGTFVAEKPPHLHHYKLLFPYHPNTRGGFWQVLRDAARELSAKTDSNFSFFYGLGGHFDSDSYREVVEDVRTARIAGLIFASGALEFQGTPVLDLPGIPRVAFAASFELPGIPKIQVDYDSFFSRAIEFLVARKRRRIAVLFGASEMDSHLSVHHKAFARSMGNKRLTINPLWTQYVHLWSPLAARHCVRLMLHEGQAERPDGLIIADDSLAVSATQGVADAGRKASKGLDVVCMTNFPGTLETAIPVTRLGFAVDVMLREQVNSIDQIRAGGKPPEFRQYPALLENEYRASAASRLRPPALEMPEEAGQ